MKFLCPHCQAKYQIPDEKVAGRSLRMDCRKCNQAIFIRADATVHGTPSRTSIAPEAAQNRASAPNPVASPVVAASPSRTSIAHEAPSAQPARVAPPAAPRVSAPNPPLDRAIWHIAIDEKPVGPIRKMDIAAYAKQGKATLDSLVWKDGMPDWAPLRNVQELTPLILSRPSMPPPLAPRTSGSHAGPPPAPPAGAPHASQSKPTSAPQTRPKSPSTEGSAQSRLNDLARASLLPPSGKSAGEPAVAIHQQPSHRESARQAPERLSMTGGAANASQERESHFPLPIRDSIIPIQTSGESAGAAAPPLRDGGWGDLLLSVPPPAPSQAAPTAGPANGFFPVRPKSTDDPKSTAKADGSKSAAVALPTETSVSQRVVAPKKGLSPAVLMAGLGGLLFVSVVGWKLSTKSTVTNTVAEQTNSNGFETLESDVIIDLGDLTVTNAEPETTGATANPPEPRGENHSPRNGASSGTASNGSRVRNSGSTQAGSSDTYVEPPVAQAANPERASGGGTGRSGSAFGSPTTARPTAFREEGSSEVRLGGARINTNVADDNPSELSDQEIRRAISTQQRALQACWAAAQRSLGPVERLRVDVQLTISRAGAVTLANARSGTSGADALTGCMETRVRGWRFPTSNQDVQTQFSMTFNGGQH